MILTSFSAAQRHDKVGQNFENSDPWQENQNKTRVTFFSAKCVQTSRQRRNFVPRKQQLQHLCQTLWNRCTWMIVGGIHRQLQQKSVCPPQALLARSTWEQLCSSSSHCRTAVTLQPLLRFFFFFLTASALGSWGVIYVRSEVRDKKKKKKFWAYTPSLIFSVWT